MEQHLQSPLTEQAAGIKGFAEVFLNGDKRRKEEVPYSNSMAEFPALSGSPNGMYNDNLRNIGYRPTLGKQSSFHLQKEDFPALPQHQNQHQRTSSEFNPTPSAASTTSPTEQTPSLPIQSSNLLSLLHDLKSARGFLYSGTDLSSLSLDQSLLEGVSFDLPKSISSVSLPKTMWTNGKVKSLLGLESLFAAFYNSVKDVKQCLAAEELYSRSWKFHIEEGIWLSRVGSQLMTFNRETLAQDVYSGMIQSMDQEGFLSLEELNEFLLHH